MAKRKTDWKLDNLADDDCEIDTAFLKVMYYLSIFITALTSLTLLWFVGQTQSAQVTKVFTIKLLGGVYLIPLIILGFICMYILSVFDYRLSLATITPLVCKLFVIYYLVKFTINLSAMCHIVTKVTHVFALKLFIAVILADLVVYIAMHLGIINKFSGLLCFILIPIAAWTLAPAGIASNILLGVNLLVALGMYRGNPRDLPNVLMKVAIFSLMSVALIMFANVLLNGNSVHADVTEIRKEFNCVDRIVETAYNKVETKLSEMKESAENTIAAVRRKNEGFMETAVAADEVRQAGTICLQYVGWLFNCLRKVKRLTMSIFPGWHYEPPVYTH